MPVPVYVHSGMHNLVQSQHKLPDNSFVNPTIGPVLAQVVKTTFSYTLSDTFRSGRRLAQYSFIISGMQTS
jgi:hypothetical protein